MAVAISTSARCMQGGADHAPGPLGRGGEAGASGTGCWRDDAALPVTMMHEQAALGYAAGGVLVAAANRERNPAGS